MAYSHLHKKLLSNFDVLIPFLRFEQELDNELLLIGATLLFKSKYYYLVENLKIKPIWAQDWWPQSQVFQFANKSEALNQLKNMKNLGVYLSSEANPKLSSSIKKELREFKLKRISYAVPSTFNFKYFAWTVHNDKQLIICENPVSQFPLGWHEFNEDKFIPPNRAYLKLWEVLALNYIQLSKNDVAIDLGSSPGGWSWALSEQIKKVYSIDKAPLDKKISNRNNIFYQSDDAFNVNPQKFSDCTWLFSDIICTPNRLLSLVEKWQAESNVKNFVCTLKFKGSCDFDILQKFNKISNSRIIHLYQNKNEVTWIKQG